MAKNIPGDVYLALAYGHGPDGPGAVLYLDTADSGVRIAQIRLTAEQFTALLAGQQVETFSETPLPTPPAPPRGGWLEVTLLEADNTSLICPCQGQVQILEYSTDDYAATTGFRLRQPDGTLAPPVMIENARWVYAGPPTLPPPPAQSWQAQG